MDKLVVGFGRSLVCVALLAGLTACGGGGSSSDSTTDSHTEPTSATPPAAAPASTPASTSQLTPQSAGRGNVAPQISGKPRMEIIAGQSYNFAPSAMDADGDSLTFSISSKPSWASFNTATGRLSGTPDAGDVGSHEEISIRVSDGESTRALPQFAINVVQQSNGSVTLAWQPPTENTDGTALTNLNGYKIHYGTQSGNYQTVITVNNAGLTRYVVENLAPGKYYFAITALAANGVESDFSGEASKTI